MKLTEVFHSLQGEGVHVGLPTTFVRLTGCSLRCSWCDTTYSFHGGEEVPVGAVLERIRAHAVKRVCITGGEPLDQREEVMELIPHLLSDDYEVVLETSGGVSIAGVNEFASRDRLIVSMDVKCPASNMQKRNLWENFGHLRPHDQLKFVLSDSRDYEYTKQVLEKEHERLPRNILLQPMWESPDPVGTVRIEGEPATLNAVAEWVLQDGLDVRVGTQLHKVIWGFEKGR